MTAHIWTTVKLPGFHRWPEAPDHRDYLAARHRHLFHVRVTVPAPVDDRRTVEFHDLADAVREYWPPGGEFDTWSCETIARELAIWLRDLFGVAWVNVDVSEDGESGATVEVSPHDRPMGERDPYSLAALHPGGVK